MALYGDGLFSFLTDFISEEVLNHGHNFFAVLNANYGLASRHTKNILCRGFYILLVNILM